MEVFNVIFFFFNKKILFFSELQQQRLLDTSGAIQIFTLMAKKKNKHALRNLAPQSFGPKS